ncbi:transcription factor BIM2-like [Canna indica]|uniref:Transcription factor BIM2-like n=1 Tax=Canna indica TaxID=4628 RepID=A0AAQ3JUY3_9LILI|nr:transcription factor BIM2-like [Canna indica]
MLCMNRIMCHNIFLNGCLCALFESIYNLLFCSRALLTAKCLVPNRLLTTLTQALQSSGVDLSQASISVQINLGKRATNKRSAATVTLCNSKVDYLNSTVQHMFDCT